MSSMTYAAGTDEEWRRSPWIRIDTDFKPDDSNEDQITNVECYAIGLKDECSLKVLPLAKSVEDVLIDRGIDVDEVFPIPKNPVYFSKSKCILSK